MEFKEEAVALILEQGYSVAEAANPLGIGNRYDGVHEVEFGLYLILDGLDELREKG